MQENKTYVNEDTYQTLKDVQVKPLNTPQPYEKSIQPYGSGPQWDVR